MDLALSPCFLPPNRGLPDNPSNLLHFIQEVHSHYLHQRPLHTPIIVHCRYGSPAF